MPKLPPPPRSAQNSSGFSSAAARNEAEHCSEPVELRLSVEVAERAPSLGLRGTRLRIDDDAPHERQVDHQAALAHREPRDVVTAAAHGEQQLVLTCKADGLHHIRHAGTARDQRGATVDHRVPDRASLIVLGVGRTEHRSTKSRACGS
jgi:hypothetical protein